MKLRVPLLTFDKTKQTTTTKKTEDIQPNVSSVILSQWDTTLVT